MTMQTGSTISRFSKMGRPVQAHGAHYLSDDSIARHAPSVFATTAHESRSERYAYIPTSNVLAGLRNEGFQPFYAIQGRSRVEGKAEYTKHMIRLRHHSFFESHDMRKVGQEIPEIVLINSHDGTSSYHMLAGVFRLVCTNGLVVGNHSLEIKVKHSGNVRDEVVQGAFRLLDTFSGIAETTDAMKHTILTEGEQTAFARGALAIRYGHEENAPIRPDQAIQHRRYADRQPDLWTTFNRAQENLVGGGLHGRNADNRRTTTRAVNGIDGNVGLNRALWILAEQFRAAKAA